MESNIGYSIFLNSNYELQMYQLEDNSCCVNCCLITDFTTGTRKLLDEEIFVNARDAAEFFEQLRQKYSIGEDFDRAAQEAADRA